MQDIPIMHIAMKEAFAPIDPTNQATEGEYVRQALSLARGQALCASEGTPVVLTFTRELLQRNLIPQPLNI